MNFNRLCSYCYVVKVSFPVGEALERRLTIRFIIKETMFTSRRGETFMRIRITNCYFLPLVNTNPKHTKKRKTWKKTFSFSAQNSSLFLLFLNLEILSFCLSFFFAFDARIRINFQRRFGMTNKRNKCVNLFAKVFSSPKLKSKLFDGSLTLGFSARFLPQNENDFSALSATVGGGGWELNQFPTETDEMGRKEIIRLVIRSLFTLSSNVSELNN